MIEPVIRCFDILAINVWLTNFLTLSRKGVNFINVLRAALTRAYPESIKIQIHWQYIFTLLGSAIVKSASRTLIKLTQGFEIKDLICLLFGQVTSYLRTVKPRNVRKKITPNKNFVINFHWFVCNVKKFS